MEKNKKKQNKFMDLKIYIINNKLNNKLNNNKKKNKYNF